MSSSRTNNKAAALRVPRPTTARQPRIGLLVSVALHAGLVAATFFTWSRLIEMPNNSHTVPVELVTIADETNVAAMAAPEPDKPEPDKLVQPDTQMTPPALPDFTEVQPPDPAAPDIVIKEPPKPKPETQKSKTQDFAALLNKLTAAPKPAPNAKKGTQAITGIGNANAMTADLADALKSQIYRCWNPPVGAPNANDLVVDFHLALNPDGTVSGRPQLSTGSAMAANGNAYTRAAAEAAMRAIYQCQPYRLPASRYGQWRDIDPLRFDPRDMMGQ